MKIKFFILFFLSGKLVWGQSPMPEFTFETYTTANGLTDNKTGALLQDSRGFLWIATANGLNRFDGKIFKQYNSFGKNGLTDLSINCLAEDDDGNIWIGTPYGLNKLNPFTETVTHYYDGNGAGTIPSNYCSSLYFDKKKQLWLGSEKEIALFDKKTNSFQRFPVSVHGANAKINKYINRILEDSKGRFWLATSFGVKLFNRDNKTYRSFHFAEPPGQTVYDNALISLFEDSSHVIWASTWAGSLLRYNPAKEVFEKTLIENLPGTNNYIPSIIQVKRGEKFSLLFPANNRFYFLTQVNNKYVAEPAQFLNQVKPDDPYACLFRDAEGNTWISGNGLYKIKAEPEALQRVINDGAGGRWHSQIIPDIKNPETGFYLVSDDGWQQYNMTTGKITMFRPATIANKFLNIVNDWYSDDTGYWIASRSGFGYYDIYNKRATDLTSLVKEKSGQISTGFIEKDDAGKIWVTMWRSGILVYNPVTKKTDALFTDSTKPVTFFGITASDMKYHKDGNIYFCDQSNLFRINTFDYSYKIIHPPAYEEKISAGKTGTQKILITNSNRIFVSSERRIYELKNDSLVTIYPATGLSPYTIEKFKEDALGNIWVSTDKGIFKTDSTFIKWRVILPGKGWENDFYSEINTTNTGKVLFNGDQEIGVLTDSLLPQGNVPPLVIINRIKYGEKQNYFVSLHPVHIRSSFKDAIEIELSAIDFANENKIMYQLDGWDNNWKELTGTSVIRYEQLPPGDYTFKTKSANTEGDESKETVLKFTVVPPFYRTWWFISLAALLITASLYFIYRYRLQKAVEMEKLRTRIATDLHDDIGATLSSISMYSQAVKSQLKEKNPQLENVLDKMGENSRDMVTSMSDIVWAINPDNDDGEKLIKRMENYATDICAVKNIQLHFKTDEKLKTTVLPLEHRKNIYLIFKEAVNNAVKYSGAQNVRVRLSLQNKNLSLIIKDDGNGFDEAAVKKGNGLKNLQTRAEEIKGTIAVDSHEGKGTTVSLVCTV
jgi:ligand-binding sensor domain-containing protein/two-component sensor histidine kinase